MRNTNLGRRNADVALGRVSTVVAGSRGITVRDGIVTARPVRDILFNGATVTDNDDGTIVVTIGQGGVLIPEATVTATKASGNPTFNGDFIPENVIKVGSTYYCVGQTWTLTPDRVHLWTATDVDGPWTASGSNPIYQFGSIPWSLGTADDIYAPEIAVDGSTYLLFYSVSNRTTGADGKMGRASASAITGPYTDSGAAILAPGSAGAWDSLRVGEMCRPVLFNGLYFSAYMGETTAAAFGASEKAGIITATSLTGTWTKYAGNPVVDHGANGEWDDDLIADPYLFIVGSRLWMVYSGGGSVGGTGTRKWHLGLAYSDDGFAWTKFSGNPILSASSSGWDEMAAWRGSIYEEAGVFSGVYGGLNSDLSVAKGGNFTLNIDSAAVAETPDAEDVDITDAGGYFTGTDVEAALQELGAIAGGEGSLIMVDAGTPTVDSGDPFGVTITTNWGVTTAGVPYYDTVAATAGDEAALVWDAATDEYALIPYDF